MYNPLMAHKITAPVSVAALQWARESAGYATPEEVIAHLTSKAQANILLALPKWERGEMRPTVPEARELAKFYSRPITDLYLRKIPEDMKGPELPDFRRDGKGKLIPGLRLLLRQTDERQKWAREFLLESGDEGFSPPLPPFSRNAEAAGESIREWLGVDGDKLAGMKPVNGDAPNYRRALEYWTERAERKGVLVMHSQRCDQKQFQIPRGEFSGFFIADDLAPVVVLNHQDSEARRIFTLAHELAHLYLSALGKKSAAKSGISRVEFRADFFAKNSDEAWCNRAAAAALLPRDSFLRAWNGLRGEGEAKIERIAEQFKVSKTAAALRALALGEFISQRRFERLRQQFKKQSEAAKQSDKGTPRRHMHAEATKRTGNRLGRLTLDAYERGDISALDVSYIFGAKLNYLSRIAKRLNFPLHRWNG